MTSKKRKLDSESSSSSTAVSIKAPETKEKQTNHTIYTVGKLDIENKPRISEIIGDSYPTEREALIAIVVAQTQQLSKSNSESFRELLGLAGDDETLFCEPTDPLLKLLYKFTSSNIHKPNDLIESLREITTVTEKELTSLKDRLNYMSRSLYAVEKRTLPACTLDKRASIKEVPAIDSKASSLGSTLTFYRTIYTIGIRDLEDPNYHEISDSYMSKREAYITAIVGLTEELSGSVGKIAGFFKYIGVENKQLPTDPILQLLHKCMSSEKNTLEELTDWLMNAVTIPTKDFISIMHKIDEISPYIKYQVKKSRLQMSVPFNNPDGDSDSD